MNFQHDPQKVN